MSVVAELDDTSRRKVGRSATLSAPPRARHPFVVRDGSGGQCAAAFHRAARLQQGRVRDLDRPAVRGTHPGRQPTARQTAAATRESGARRRSWRARSAGAPGADDRDLARLLKVKSRAHDWVRATERVWDFYFELFGQRQGAYGEWLFACDRIALDCYRHVFMHLGSPVSIPSPPPFAYMRTGFSPATYRRNIPLRKLGRQLNPFPLVQLPYHRLVNPWTMGAILHEVSHNLQNELELQRVVPASIMRAVRAVGAPPAVARTWGRWNREIFGDMVGCMLGGEAFVASSDGRDRAVARPGARIQPRRRPSDAVPAHVLVHGTVASHGVSGDRQSVRAHVAKALSVHIGRQHPAQRCCGRRRSASVRWSTPSATPGFRHWAISRCERSSPSNRGTSR